MSWGVELARGIFKRIRIGAVPGETAASILFIATGSPEGVSGFEAAEGSICLSGGGSVYRKGSGSGNTGWVEMTSGGGSGSVTNTGTLTDHGVVLGNGGVDVQILAPGITGQVLFGVTGADPAFSNIGIPKVVVKSGDQSVTSSASPVDDNHLLFAIAASETWIIEIVLFVIGATAGDIRLGLSAPASATGTVGTVGLVSTATGPTADVALDVKRNDFTDSGVNGVAALTDPGTVIVLKAVVINSTNAGNVKLRWAQLASSGTSTTVKAGSYLTAIRVA